MIPTKRFHRISLPENKDAPAPLQRPGAGPLTGVDVKDRSMMPPERAILGTDDEWTLQQRYDQIREERDQLELKVRELSSIIVDLIQGRQIEALSRYHPTAGTPQAAGAAARQAHLEDATPIVYYLRRDDHTVKIGMTTSIIARLQAFHAQPADLLAVEPGGLDIERTRHQQFAATRLDGTELFGLDTALSHHIDRLHRHYPDPIDAAMRFNRLGQYAAR